VPAIKVLEERDYGPPVTTLGAVFIHLMHSRQ
jgi:hypothetical protein